MVTTSADSHGHRDQNITLILPNCDNLLMCHSDWEQMVFCPSFVPLLLLIDRALRPKDRSVPIGWGWGRGKGFTVLELHSVPDPNPDHDSEAFSNTSRIFF